MKAMLGLVNGLVTTRNTRGDKSPAEMGRAKRGGLRRTHTLYPRCKCLHRVIFNSVGALVGRKAGLLVITLLCHGAVGLTQLPIAFLLELEAVAHESPYSTA
jgi:hypothetical protein